MATYYESVDKYLGTAQDLKDRINKIEQVITALYNTAERAAAKGDISQYSLDDGQVRISTTYKSVEDIMHSIESFEKLKQMYINQLQGRMVRLVDGRNFKRGGRGRTR